ncbi:MAG: glycosyltransferase family 4 protein, partial [Anaerolineales bacterium]|nr:glycosyltransferase family 4 protein [Anaerolineales bacterium]
MIEAAFFMEQHIGHRTFYENVRGFIDLAPDIAAYWTEITYFERDGWWERLPLLSSHVRGTLRGRAQVRHGLQRYPADVTLFNTHVPAALAGSLNKRRPYVICTDITPRQYDRMAAHYNHKPDKGGPLATYKHAVNLRMMRDAARVLPWSTWARTSLLQDYGVSPDRVEVIPPGVDIAIWQPKLRGDENGRSVKILFVGGDFYRKGGHVLLQAFRALPPGTAELHLVTRTSIAEEEWVHVYPNLRPNDPELVALYQSCDVFALPTEAEAFGIAAVEAGAVGLPVITTAVGGLTDIVVNGETG